MRLPATLVALAFVLLPAGASAQLPSDLKDSDLGPGVPPMRVRPGYRVTRAVPD